jgi:hypothetical protein
LGAAQVALVAPVVQAQVALLQQTPVHGLGVHEPPQMKVTPAPVHRPWLMGAQAQVAMVQQAPRQGLGVQVPAQEKMFGETQVETVAPVVHVHVGVQQMPVHGLGVQVFPQ